MTRIFIRLVCLSALLLTGICRTAASEAAQMGELRLKLSGAAAPGGLHLPLFREWSGVYQSASVLSASGRRLAFRGERQMGKLSGLTLQAGAEDFPVTVVLQTAPHQPSSPEAVLSVRPVLLHTGDIPLTTRAFSMPEMLRLAGHPPFHRRNDAGQTVAFPGQLPAGGKGAALLKVRTRHCRLLIWNAHFLLDRDRLLKLGVKDSTSAWMMLLDGRPVNGWQEPAPVVPCPLQAGAHRLQYFVFLNSGEDIPVPELKFTGDSAPLFGDTLVPWNLPAAMTVFFPDGKETELSLASEQPVFWPGQGTSFSVWNLQIREQGRSRKETWIQTPDRTEVGSFSCGNSRLTLELPRFWLPPLNAGGHLRWASAEEDRQVFFQDEACRLGIRLEMQRKLFRRLGKALQIAVEEKDRAGRTCAVHLLSSARPGDLLFSRKLSSGTVSLSLQARFHGRKVLDGGTIRLLRPEDKLDRLELRGNTFFLDGGQALFICPRPAGNFSFPHKTEHPRRIYFFENSRGLIHPRLLMPGSGDKLFFSQMELQHSSGSSPEQQEWLACSRMTRMKPEAALLNLKIRRIVSEQDFPVYFRKLSFMIQYMLHRGIHPVLVCPPAFSRENREFLRLQALYTKEFAWRYGLDVLDFYSIMQKSGMPGNRLSEDRNGVGYLELSEACQQFFMDCLRQFFKAPAP